ncbi:MAG TPA: extracellular solute-binding protein [Candidatus Latescibacteria bacterium]|nr:extracellular solute-binding protein [Candidatus Latescibacterota bacterium]
MVYCFRALLICLLFSTSWASSGDTTLVVWGIGEGEGQVGFFAAVEAFERANPGVRVSTSPSGGGQNPQKMLTAIVGGAAPDVMNQDRFTVSSWAARDAFLPLDGRLAAQDTTAPDAIRKSEYYTACWNETVFRGKVYAIPNGTDARALYYNFAEFRRVGLVDSAGVPTPPRTWRELGLFSLRLAVNDALENAGLLDADGNLIPPATWRDVEVFNLLLGMPDAEARARMLDDPRHLVLPPEWTSGMVNSYRFPVTQKGLESGIINPEGKMKPPAEWKFRRIGFIPVYGNVWLHMYAWQNHGKFMSPDGRTCTLNDPRIVEALEWMAWFYDMFGGRPRVEAFSSSFQGQFLDPFLTGFLAMKVETDGMLGAIARYKPDLEFGVCLTPLPEGGKPTTWSGGFSWAIPRNARHPDIAWRFIRHMVNYETVRLVERTRMNFNRSRGRPYVMGIPANRETGRKLAEEFLDANPDLPQRLKDGYSQYFAMMEFSDFRDVTPASQLLWDEIQRATNMATYRKLTPKEAADAGAATVQQELDRLFSSSAGEPVNWTAVALVVLLLVAGGGAAGYFYSREKLHLGRMGRADLVAGLGFISPWLAGFLIFTVGPFIISIVLSFTEYNMLSPARWVGLKHYSELFTNDPIFWKSLGNTIYMMIGVPLGMAVGLGVAMLLNSNVRGMSWYRTVYYLPAIVPTVASSILWIWVLHPTNGILNIILEYVGLGQPLWLQSEHWSKPAIIVMGLWGAGSSMIIWLAGLKGIPDHLYEAAQIDGAGKWRQFVHVTLPMLSPYIFFNLIMGVIGTLQIFAQAFIMTSGGPVDSTLFYVYYLFNNAFQYLRMGYASAMAWILFVIILGLTLVQLKLAPRWVHYEGGGK